MRDLSAKNFGLLIAYVLPGTVTLIGVAAFSTTVSGWLTTSTPVGPSIGGFLFVTLASVAAGMAASAVRWVIIDRLHHWTGVVKPAWDDSKLPERLEAFEAIVEAHYRYYQFYSNSLVALLFSYAAWCSSLGVWPVWPDLGISSLSAIFFAVSRDNLRRYYSRTAVLLGTLNKESHHEQRSRSTRSPRIRRRHRSRKERSGAEEG
jgi:hypothetical protein